MALNDNVVVAGYYGFQNAGDELLLLATIQRLKKEHVGHITVLSQYPEQTHNAFSVDAISRWNPFRCVQAFLKADRLVLGGGGLLQESTGWGNHFYYLSLVVLAKLLRCRTELWSMGIDPIDNIANRWMTRWVLNYFTDSISVRDRDSFRVLDGIGVYHRILTTPDLMMSLALPESKSISKQERIPSRRILMALTPWSQRPGWEHDLGILLDRMIQQLGVTIDLVPFYPLQDEEICEKVAALMGREECIVRRWKQPTELLSWISDYDFVVGMRYHALVLAVLASKPFIGWGYQRKVRSLCQDSEQPMWSFERGWDVDAVYRQISEAWRQRELLPGRYHERSVKAAHLFLSKI